MRAILLALACVAFTAARAICGPGVEWWPQADVSRPASSPQPSRPDSSAVPSATSGPPSVPGDVRRVLSGNQADVLSREPSVRLVGSGWRGHRASVGVGALPATFTAVSMCGRAPGEAITDGLDLLSARALSPGGIVTVSGPDLSRWPAYASALPSLSTGLEGRPIVSIRPGRRPSEEPYARVTMGQGDPAWQALSAEFGRTCCDGRLGLSAFFEASGGGAPLRGASHDIEIAGARLLIPISGRWLFEASAHQSDQTGWVPGGRADVDSLRTNHLARDVSLRGTDGRSRVEIFHSTAHVNADATDGRTGTVASSRDGAAVRLALSGRWSDAFELSLASRRVEGSLLAEGTTDIEVSGGLERGVDLDGGWRLFLTGGWSALGGRGFAIGTVAASAPGGWAVGLFADGRHPAAIERFLAPFEIPGSVGDVFVSGSPGLTPERALGARASWTARAGAGARAEIARILDPVALGPAGRAEAAPVNGTDETTASLSLWAGLGDTSRSGVRASADFLIIDEDGAVLSRAPIPTAAVAASAWTTRSFFARGYLETRWELSVAHEAGRARGPWGGRLDDSSTMVSAAVSARADCARLYLLAENLLDDRAPRIPGLPGAGRSLTAGFSWTFRN